MAIGMGLMLPWVTSTCSAAAAGRGASAARNRAQMIRSFLMPFSKDISRSLFPKQANFRRH